MQCVKLMHSLDLEFVKRIVGDPIGSKSSAAISLLIRKRHSLNSGSRRQEDMQMIELRFTSTGRRADALHHPRSVVAPPSADMRQKAAYVRFSRAIFHADDL